MLLEQSLDVAVYYLRIILDLYRKNSQLLE